MSNLPQRKRSRSRDPEEGGGRKERPHGSFPVCEVGPRTDVAGFYPPPFYEGGPPQRGPPSTYSGGPPRNRDGPPPYGEPQVPYYADEGWRETVRAPPRPVKMVLDAFGRLVPEEEHLANLEREAARRRERETKREGPPRALKSWEMPDPEELAAAAAAKAAEEKLDPEEAAMAKALGFSSFTSTKGKEVEDNSHSAAKGAFKKVTIKKYRQYMNRKEGQRSFVKNSSAH